jgi:hypothetical protein
MRGSKLSHFVQVALFGALAVFGFSFSHTSTLRTMAGMSGMEQQATKSAVCQSICMSAVPVSTHAVPLPDEVTDKDPVVLMRLVATASLSLLVLTFIVKQLYRLSSWRPPDIVSLYGHYADGL